MLQFPFRSLTSVCLFMLSASNSVGDELTVQEIVQAAIPAIVSIRSETSEGRRLGTGFLVKSDGVIVTNLHVIEGASRVEIKLHSGEVHSQVRVASYDQSRDLAILRIPGFDLPIVAIGNSDTVATGESVVAIGSPGGLEETVTSGIVSSVRVLENGIKVIQTDSAVSPGSSGGPLISSTGEVVGIVTYKFLGGENLNFAIPVNYARGLLGIEDLMSLEQFNGKISTAPVSLFSESGAESSDSVTGIWLSLTSNTERQLNQSGEYVYGSYDASDPRTGEVSKGTYDLKQVNNNQYEGTSSHQYNCWYYKWGTKIENQCVDTIETKITLLAEDRIEGSAYMRPRIDLNDRDFKNACDLCFQNIPREWQAFVWVRKK